MRSIVILAILAVVLVSVAIVARTGVLARKNPGAPINSAMREAMGQQILPESDRLLVEARYPEATLTPSGLRFIVRRPGREDVTPRRGQQVSVHYRAHFLDGTPFDDSYARGGPFNFQVGLGKVIPGWDEAVTTMSPGEHRTLIIPYWLAYGERGIRGKIPARATLVFDVELLGFVDPAPGD